MASRAKKKWRYRQNKIHPELEKQLVSTRLWNGEEPVSGSFGQQKMSRIFLDFVKPYTATAESEEQFRMAIQLGLIAWNIALIPAEVRKENLESLIHQAAPASAADFLAIVNEMVERKERHFAHCRRWILAHHLTMTPRRPHLSVVSTAE